MDKINLKDKTITDLKVIAYDLSESINKYTEILNAINAEISERKKLIEASAKKESPN